MPSEESASPPRAFPLVLFGSQTGTAADVADKVWRRALTRGARPLRDVRVRAMDDYLDEVDGALPPFPAAEWAVIFVCATAGQGDPPDNMIRFWRRLMRKSVPQNACKGLKIAVLGLGDSSYPKYNFVAKKLYRRMVQLGAESLLPLSLADDQHPLGIDATLTPWLDDLLEGLITASGSEPPPLPSAAELAEIPFKFRVDRFLSEEEATRGRLDAASAIADDCVSEPPFMPPGAFASRLTSNQRLTSADHFQDTRHVVLAVPEDFPKHRPGQVLLVQPSNSSDTVATFFSLLHPSLGPNTRVTVTAAHPTCHPITTPGWPQPCSLGWLARHIFDLTSVPRKAFFELMGVFSPNETERERLGEFCDPANLDEMLDYCQRARRTCVEVLQDFPATASGMDPRQLLELMPQIRPRAFSIASSSAAHRGELHLLVAVVNYKTRALVKRRRGLCSNYLAELAPDSTVPVWMAPGHGLRFPEGLSVPLIMIGPGTGLAPFRSVIHERRWGRETEEKEEEEEEEDGTKAKDQLVFGCRYKDKDFYFREEWEELVAKGQLELTTAFSREETSANGARLYVQDRLRAKAILLWRLLQRDGAFLYVAGSSKGMPDAVRSAVTEVVRRGGRMSEAEAEAFVVNLERCGRYQTETWA